MHAENHEIVSLVELFPANCIVHEMSATDRDGVIKELVDTLVETGSIKKSARKKLIEDLIERETQGSTGVGGGAAAPHTAVKDLGELLGVIGRSSKGADFNCITGEKVHVFFLVLYAPDMQAERRMALGRLIELSRSTNLIRFVKAAKSVKEIVDLLKEMDGER